MLQDFGTSPTNIIMHSSLSRGPLQATPVSGALFPGAAVIGTAVSAAKHKRCNKHISRAAPFDINELYVSNSTDVTPYVGPIKAVRLKGKLLRVLAAGAPPTLQTQSFVTQIVTYVTCYAEKSSVACVHCHMLKQDV